MVNVLLYEALQLRTNTLKKNWSKKLSTKLCGVVIKPLHQVSCYVTKRTKLRILPTHSYSYFNFYFEQLKTRLSRFRMSSISCQFTKRNNYTSRTTSIQNITRTLPSPNLLQTNYQKFPESGEVTSGPCSLAHIKCEDAQAHNVNAWFCLPPSLFGW